MNNGVIARGLWQYCIYCILFVNLPSFHPYIECDNTLFIDALPSPPRTFSFVCRQLSGIVRAHIIIGLCHPLHQPPTFEKKKKSQCEYSSPKGPCLTVALGGQPYCERHTCEKEGCTAMKKSTDKRCDKYVTLGLIFIVGLCHYPSSFIFLL